MHIYFILLVFIYYFLLGPAKFMWVWLDLASPAQASDLAGQSNTCVKSRVLTRVATLFK